MASQMYHQNQVPTKVTSPEAMSQVLASHDLAPQRALPGHQLTVLYGGLMGEPH